MFGRKPVICTVDVLAFIDNVGGPNVVMIRRNIPPFKDKLVLPGGHVDFKDESLAHAAARELFEETNIRVNPLDLFFYMTLDGPKRDPRNDARRVSTVFLTILTQEDVGNMKASSDAREVILRNIDSITEQEVGFDHWSQLIQNIQADRRSCKWFWNELNEDGHFQHVCQLMIECGWTDKLKVICPADQDIGKRKFFLEGHGLMQQIWFCPVCGQQCPQPGKDDVPLESPNKK